MSYILDIAGERKGFGKKDKYKSRTLRITTDGVFEEWEKKKLRTSIHLKKDDYSEIKANDNENKKGKCSATFEITFGGKVYDYAVSSDSERNQFLETMNKIHAEQQEMDAAIASGNYDRAKPNNDDFKEIQDIFDNSTLDFKNKKERSKQAAQTWKAVKKDPQWKREIYILRQKHGGGGGVTAAAAVSDPGGDDVKSAEPEPEPEKKKKKGWGGFGALKEKAAAGAAALKDQAADAAAKGKEAAAKKKSGFGGFGGFGKKQGDEPAAEEEPAAEPEEPATNEPVAASSSSSKPAASEQKYDAVEDEAPTVTANGNINPLRNLKLDDLMQKDISGFHKKLAVEVNDVRYDAVASNEFCQIAIGMGLVTADDSDDEEEEEKGGKGRSRLDSDAGDKYKYPNVTHDGTIGKSITFQPEDRDFTFVAEFKCTQCGDDDNYIFSNGDFEIFAPRGKANLIGVRWVQDKKKEEKYIYNCGETKIKENVWYQIIVVVNRADLEDKYAQTRFRAYLNGIADGEASIKKSSGGLMGGLFGKKKKKKGGDSLIGQDPESKKKFAGQIKNVKIFYEALSEADIGKLAFTKESSAYHPTRIISFKQESIKVHVPQCDIKYNGPIPAVLPDYQQGILMPDADTEFTISAYILIARTRPQGSALFSSYATSGKARGLTFYAAMPKTGVIGFRCSCQDEMTFGKSAGKPMNVGNKVLEQNKWYHVAITVQRRTGTDRENDYQVINGTVATVVTAYINGRKDGAYTFQSRSNMTLHDFTSPDNTFAIGQEVNAFEDTDFSGAICSLRVFKDRALKECEVAAVYASDKAARRFKKGQEIFVGQGGIMNGEKDAVSKKLAIENVEWVSGKFVSLDKETGKATVTVNGSEQAVMANTIISAEADPVMIDGSVSTKISTLGGKIEGEDFNGKQFEIYSSDSGFLQYICNPSSLSLLCQNKPFPKHVIELLVDNPNVNNDYILNRVLYGAYEILCYIYKKENKTKNWKYFNEFILPWAKLWAQEGAFKKLKDIATTLQKQFLIEQGEFYEKLTKDYKDHTMFTLERKPHAEIKNRQDANFKNAMTTECIEKDWEAEDRKYTKVNAKELEKDPDKKGDDKVFTYDQTVSTMMVWGRNLVLLEPFQRTMKEMYAATIAQHHYVAGPIKTYERMKEKAEEYKVEDKAPHPAAYRITDVLRCSIKCHSLDDINKAYEMLAEKMTIIRIKNRFHKDFDAPKLSGGYRDMLVNVLFEDEASGLAAICEVQFHLIEYAEIKNKQHRYYKVNRAIDSRTLLLNYEARKFEEKKAGKKKDPEYYQHCQKCRESHEH